MSHCWPKPTRRSREVSVDERRWLLTALEGDVECEWADCDRHAAEYVTTCERTWLLCVAHAVVAKATSPECATGDW
jgi:hypothetical protein